MSPRAPYGSKQIKVVLAALELYEFTQNQLINFAGDEVSIADFENAKREGSPLELGKVLVEQGLTAKTSRSGRPSKIYTFRSPAEYDELRSWANSYKHDLSSNVPESLENVNPSDIHLGENPDELSDLEEKISQITLFMIRSDVSKKELVVWGERALRYIANWISEYNSSDIIRSNNLYAQKKIKHQIQSFQVRLYLLILEEKLDFDKRIEYLFGILNELLNYCLDNLHNLETVRYFGLLDVGLKLIDNLSSVQKDYLQLSASINRYSVTWIRGQWEELHNRIQLIFQGQDNELALAIFQYWLGSYNMIISEIDQGEKNILPEILRQLSNKPSSTGELLKTLEA